MARPLYLKDPFQALYQLPHRHHGVYEAIDIALEMGLLDIKAEPKVIAEGPTWATIDGNRSSGYWCLNMMADIAIEKAKTQGIAIVFGGNHNDAGSFARYVYKAFEQDMMAFSSNNTVPLAAPFGGLFNKLSCAPFDAITPAGDRNPIWTSVAQQNFMMQIFQKLLLTTKS